RFGQGKYAADDGRKADEGGDQLQASHHAPSIRPSASTRRAVSLDAGPGHDVESLSGQRWPWEPRRAEYAFVAQFVRVCKTSDRASARTNIGSYARCIRWELCRVLATGEVYRRTGVNGLAHPLKPPGVPRTIRDSGTSARRRQGTTRVYRKD